MRSTGNWGAMALVAAVVVATVFAAVLLTTLSRPASPGSPASPASSASTMLAAASPSTSASAPVSPSAAPSTPVPGPTSSGAGGSAPASAVTPPASSRGPGLPDRALTPGAVNPNVTPSNLASTICASGWTAKIRPPSAYTTALKRQQIAQYGYTDTKLADYEEDHLISLELGGAPRDPANLWPEPYAATLPDGTKVGARVKDQLENRLNHLVCSGSMPLATAQRLIATDWLGAWRQYVAP